MGMGIQISCRRSNNYIVRQVGVIKVECIHNQAKCAGGEDSDSFSLVRRPGSDKAELVTMVELDYESPRKRFDLIVRAASPPLRSDVHVEILVTDVNDNAPRLKDFHVR